MLEHTHGDLRTGVVEERRQLQREVSRTFDANDVARYYDEWNERYEAVSVHLF